MLPRLVVSLEAGFLIVMLPLRDRVSPILYMT